MAAIEVKPHVKKNSVAVELTDFSVFYSQDSIAVAEATLKDKASKIVVEKGQIVKVSKDAKGIVSREVLTKSGRTGLITGRWISTLRASARLSGAGKPPTPLTEGERSGMGENAGPGITSLKTSGNPSAPRKTARWN